MHVLRPPSVTGQAAAEIGLVDPGGAKPEVLRAVEPDLPRLAVVGPVGKRCDHPHAVEALFLAVPHVVFESRLWAQWPRRVVVVPGEAICGGRPPRVTEDEAGGSVGILQGMPVIGRDHHAAPHDVLTLLRLGPWHSDEPAGDSAQAAVVGAVRSTGPGPFAGGRRQHTHPERRVLLVLAVPEAPDFLVERGTPQPDPARDVAVDGVVTSARLEGDLVGLPAVDPRHLGRGHLGHERRDDRRYHEPSCVVLDDHDAHSVGLSAVAGFVREKDRGMILPRPGREGEDAQQTVAEPGRSGLGPDRWRDSEDGHDPTKRRGDSPRSGHRVRHFLPDWPTIRNNAISNLDVQPDTRRRVPLAGYRPA